ncbi:thioredoxin domain-containing protein [Kribbella sp. NPDC051770]|uniref:DsbA family protein n=1 Tax=Kribbella sp. NPDC051770 TaxID=3155413 RepID=UPI0034247721
MSKSKTPVNPLLESKKRRIGPGVVVVVILVLALGAGVGVQYWRSNSGVSVSGGGTEPAVITGPGTNGQGVKVGQASAKVNIDVYLDFRCPHCKDFEDESGDAIDKLVDDGTATLTYWPMMFVNPDNSPRLANAFAAAAAEGKARSYANELYADFAKSWTEEQLIELGKQLKVDDAKFEAAVKDNSHAGWLESVAQAADNRKVEGTPTVFVNDKQLPADALTPEGITAAVTEAKG